MNGDGDLTDANELDELNPLSGGSAHFNKANELLARDTDTGTTSADNYTLAYDDVGSLTDDGKDHEYVYDAFGRLRIVLNTSNQALVAEYWYNPQGHRITWHFDTTQNGGGAPDGTVDADDPKFHLIYNERWQHVATYRQEDGDPIDSDPKEQFLYHTAGLAGYGSSSYIDAVILRDDHDDVWTDEADATLDRRVYYCQNWRADVVAILAANGRIIERSWYEPYGTPHGSTNGDFTGSATGADDHYLVPNGIVDGDDQTVFSTLFSAPDDLADMTGSSDSGDPDYGRPDGTIDASDLFFWLDCHAAADDLGRNVLSEGHTGASLGTFSVRNRKGLVGYEWDPAIRKYHVRNRVLDPDTGRWSRRDPAIASDSTVSHSIRVHSFGTNCTTCPRNQTEPATSQGGPSPGDPNDPGHTCGTLNVAEHASSYHDGMNLTQYTRSSPIYYVDDSGLACTVTYSCSIIRRVRPNIFSDICTCRCIETSRKDSFGHGVNCSDMPDPPHSFEEGCDCGTYRYERKIVYLDDNGIRDCSRSSCNKICNASYVTCLAACCATGPGATACRTACSFVRINCSQWCNYFCRKP